MIGQLVQYWALIGSYRAPDQGTDSVEVDVGWGVARHQLLEKYNIINIINISI